MTSAKALEVHALWDESAQVWIATSEDIPGLCVQAGTFEELLDTVAGLAPDLLELNGVTLLEQTVPIHLTAERTAAVRLHG